MPRNCAKDLIDEIEYLLPQELQKHKQVRQKFTNEEDALIINLVGDNQFPNWNEIAKSIPSKTGRQCRERFQNYLSPDLSKEPWTKEEDDLIIKLYKDFGSSWSLIADYFGGKRTNNNIKNRWNSHLKAKYNNLAFMNQEISNDKKNQKLEKNKITNSAISNNNSSNSIIPVIPTNFFSNNYKQMNLFPAFHQRNNQQILRKLVLMNQEPIIRRELQQKVIRQRQQKHLQNQQSEIHNENGFSDYINELTDPNVFNQDFIFNGSDDFEIFNDQYF